MSAIQREALALVETQRWAALAVSEADGPSASMVAYAIDADRAALVIFVSRLARHTQVLLETGRAALVVSAADTGEGDPQLLPRVSLRCAVDVPETGSPAFAQAGAHYVRRFPDALPRFELGGLRADPPRARRGPLRRRVRPRGQLHLAAAHRASGP